MFGPSASCRSWKKRALPFLALVGLVLVPVAQAQQLPTDEPGGGPQPERRRTDEEEDEAAEQRRAAEALEEEEEQAEEEEEQEEEPEPTVRLPDSAYEGQTVLDVQVRGVRAVAVEDVRATISTQAGAPYAQSEIQRDARALWDLAFFQEITIEAIPATRRGRRGVIIRLTLRERPTIGAIRFDGNDEVDDDDIDDEIELREGAILSIPNIRRAVQDIRDLYAEKGFFLAEVTYRTERFEAETEQVDIVFRIVERMDAGPIVVTRSTAIKPEEKAEELHDRLAAIGVDAVRATFDLFADGANPPGEAQDDSASTKAP